MKTAIDLAREWDGIFATLATEALETGEIVKSIELKDGYQHLHPFYAGKLALLRYLKSLNDLDIQELSESQAEAMVARYAKMMPVTVRPPFTIEDDQ